MQRTQSQPPPPCPICTRQLITFPRETDDNHTLYQCDVCGTFALPRELYGFAKKPVFPEDKAHLLSAYLRANPTLVNVPVEVWNSVRDGGLREKSVDEKIALVFRVFCERSKIFGDKVRVDPSVDFPLAWCRTSKEWENIVGSLGVERKWLQYEHPAGYSVTDRGWQAAQAQGKGEIGFVAMSFNPHNPNLMPVSDAIKEAIRLAGYSALRIDEDPHNGGIMDRIIARIRQSRFVVADLTENRGGVYYEAGFALGLGLPVFLTSDVSQLNKKSDNAVHFDVAHINITPWAVEALPKFTEDLQAKIEATIGKGPRLVLPPQ